MPLRNSKNKHFWQAFVRLQKSETLGLLSKYISKVKFGNTPDKNISLDGKEFVSMPFYHHARFLMNIKIIWKRETGRKPDNLELQLGFHEDGGTVINDVRFEFDSRKLQ
jgi:hypothetical protein